MGIPAMTLGEILWCVLVGLVVILKVLATIGKTKTPATGAWIEPTKPWPR